MRAGLAVVVKSGAVDTKAMLSWFEADLAKANANRAKVPWIVVHGHRSVYCSIALSDDGDCIDIVGFGPAVREMRELINHQELSLGYGESGTS